MTVHSTRLFTAIVFRLDLDNSLNLPIPVLTTKNGMPVDRLHSFVDPIMKTYGQECEKFWTSNIDENVLEMILEESLVGPSFRLYWQVWNKAYTYELFEE